MSEQVLPTDDEVNTASTELCSWEDSVDDELRRDRGPENFAEGAKWMRAKVQTMIDKGLLIRRDRLESGTSVGVLDGDYVTFVTIGRKTFHKKISSADYDELLRRGAKVFHP